MLEHMGFATDTHRGLFFLPAHKVRKLAMVAKKLIYRALRGKSWVPSCMLASFGGLAASALLDILPARFSLREFDACMHADVSWPGHVQLSKRALSDLRWWAALPSKWNGRPIWSVHQPHLAH